jgi:peptide-methionine (S)-S-oxide reductase
MEVIFMKSIVLAGGCFWGVQAYFKNKKGILSTKVGYANGNIPNPTYELVCNSNTGFAESTYISYDESIMSLTNLLKTYWLIIDPTVKNKQGHDIGNQYRTGIFYVDIDDLQTINESKKEQQKKNDKIIVTEILPLKNFYDAEEYHQDFYKKSADQYKQDRMVSGRDEFIQKYWGDEYYDIF